MCESEALSSVGEQRWNPAMAATVEVVAHPRLATAIPFAVGAVPNLVVAPTWARKISL